MTQKIIASAHRIARGQQKELQLGNIKIQRDWGWAPEYVEAMDQMLHQETPKDFVIAAGETQKLEDFVAAAFSHFGLNGKEYPARMNVCFVRPRS